MGKALFDDLLGQFPVRCARAFDQGNGLRQNSTVAAQNTIDDLLMRKSAAAGVARNQVLRRLRSYASGANKQRALIGVRQSGTSSRHTAVQDL
jgi:hypothetical protein